MSRLVVIVDYDPRWPSLYEEEKRRILSVIGHKVLALEHIGSTAVPGLGAKPIIDIMACVSGPSDADECIPLLAGIGYLDVTREEGDPDWYCCLGKASHSVGYHLHLVRYMGDFARKHLLFRDFLRSHPDTAREYYELKKRMAARYGSDRRAYTESKTSFIEGVVARARL
ncbi:MAG: GrpB family protein [Candidatus Bathyarchaeia archaeon]